MPPRFAYWTIIAGGLPTAFRAAEREELLPTFKRIQGKHLDAEMKYFARGKLWTSREEAQREAEARRAAAAQRQSARGGTARGRDWRPGGEHRDPRQKFKDAKKERNQERRKDRFERRPQSGTAERPAPRAARPEWRDRGPRTGKPAAPRDRPWRDRPPREKPHGDSLRVQTARPFARNRLERRPRTEEPQPTPPAPARGRPAKPRRRRS